MNVLKQIPSFEIVVPGTADEFKKLFLQSYDNEHPTYFRTSRDVNALSQEVAFGKANVIKKGGKATIIAVGPMLDMVMNAVNDLDVTVLYYTTLAPFDFEALKCNSASGKILVCVPFYTGGLLEDILKATENKNVLIKEIGIPRIFPKHYGYTKEHYEEFGMTKESIRSRLLEIMD